MAGVGGVDKSLKVGDKVNCCRCLPAELMYPCRALCGALRNIWLHCQRTIWTSDKAPHGWVCEPCVVQLSVSLRYGKQMTALAGLLNGEWVNRMTAVRWRCGR